MFSKDTREEEDKFCERKGLGKNHFCFLKGGGLDMLCKDVFVNGLFILVRYRKSPWSYL